MVVEAQGIGLQRGLTFRCIYIFDVNRGYVEMKRNMHAYFLFFDLLIGLHIWGRELKL